VCPLATVDRVVHAESRERQKLRCGSKLQQRRAPAHMILIPDTLPFHPHDLGRRDHVSRGRIAAVAALLVALTGTSCTGVTPRNSQLYLPGNYNFAFYDTHTRAARSFYAAHVAHFGIYEVGLTEGEDATDAFAELETHIRRLVTAPPKFEPPAELIAPAWMRMAHPTGRAMDWTHHLHSQLYDILTDPSVPDKRAAGERAIAYYLSDADAAFSTRGYGHRWMMGGGSWAGTFARKYPDINGILWAYHWHHAAVYEALMEPTPEAQARALDRVIDLFVDSVLVTPPDFMPLAAAVAPRFSKMFPAAAHIFDNLHMMHDITNDIMVDERLSREQKEAEIDRMLRSQIYATQDSVVAPGIMTMADHTMGPSSMRVPTRLPDGSWLPQGHPESEMVPMGQFMMPLLPEGVGR
jgi:hypothetical protein